MKISRFILRSFIHYWRSNLLVILGAAISTMVLTGTLIVGDSMRFSLEKTTELRLGKIEYVFSGNDRYFRADLADEIQAELNSEVAALLQQRGIASSEGGKFKLNNILVNGIDEQFFLLAENSDGIGFPMKNEAFISENLAARLQLKTGDSFLLRVEKASLVPKNAPFVSNTDNYISIRLKVGKMLTSDQLGRFNLGVSQTAPYNVFISISDLNERLDWETKANTLLFAKGSNEQNIQKALKTHWQLEDMALKISKVNDGQNLEITSERVFIDASSTDKIKKVIPDAQEILTYMANDFSLNNKNTPYSFIAAGPFSESLEKDEILINSWMAEDLNAAIGEHMEVSYFSIGPLRKLIEKKHQFLIKGIVPMEGQFAERSLMPDLPGMSDAGSCREWEAGVPISLEAIRDKDEDYWDEYRGTPKAFINYETGKTLWQNRFGSCTAIRLPSNISNEEEVGQKIVKSITTEDLGFSIQPVKEAGLNAARGGVDFAELFMGLSFFLLVAAIILMSLLFNLHLEKRIGEIGTLKAVGFPGSLIKRLLLTEGFLIAIPGVLLGIAMAVFYNKLIFFALNTIWQEIVLTSILQESIQTVTLVSGGIISIVIVGISIWINTFKRLKSASTELQRQLKAPSNNRTKKLYKFMGWALLGIAIVAIALDFKSNNPWNTGLYFMAGALLLFSFLLLMASKIGAEFKSKPFNSTALIGKSIARNSSRSLRIIILFSLGTFVTISTGLNRKDLYKNSDQLTSGTGGYQFFMETTLPILQDLNDPQYRENEGIDLPYNFIQFRKNEGDDASCLNLNLITSPRILGVQPDLLEGRFSFVTQTDDLDPEKPWASLNTELPGNVIPVILDQTVIQWGLGKSVGDTLIYKNESGQEMHLKIIGGLANSIFQGNALIDEQLFLRHFPSSSGSHVFLLDGKTGDIEESKDDIARTFRNEGIELEQTADRLAKFNQIENTYLSIFLLLGGLAMILGTIGLGISLARNLLDRRKEIGVLRAIGWSKKHVFSMIANEQLILLFLGTITGTIAAFVATLPSFLAGINQNSYLTALILVLAILVNGWFWILMISRNFLWKNLLDTIRAE